MPIKIGNKTFESFEAAVEYLVREKGYSRDTARAIVGKIEKNIQSARAAGNLPETWEDENGQFAKFFLINDQWNGMDWRVTSESVPEYIHTFENMPIIKEPNKEHFGMKPEDPVSQTLVKQENFREGSIIKAGLKDPTTAFAVVKFDDTPVGKKAFKEVNSGIDFYVSPSIVGIGKPDDWGRMTYNVWHGLHLARVENPAYGVAVASIKETCEGPGSECINRLFTSAIASKIIPIDSFKIPNSKGDQKMSSEQKPTLEEVIKQFGEIKTEVAALKTENETLKKQLESKTAANGENGCPPGEHMVDGECVKNSSSGTAAEHPGECGEGEHMVDGKCVKSATASIKDEATRKYVEQLEARVAAQENKEKEELAFHLVEAQVAADMVKQEDQKTEVEKLMKMETASLRAEHEKTIPLLEKIIQMKGSVKPGSFGKATIINTPESTGIASKGDAVKSIDEMEDYL